MICLVTIPTGLVLGTLGMAGAEPPDTEWGVQIGEVLMFAIPAIVTGIILVVARCFAESSSPQNETDLPESAVSMHFRRIALAEDFHLQLRARCSMFRLNHAKRN